MNFAVDHLGIAVKSLHSARAIYELIGLSVTDEEEVPAEQVRVAMVPVGETRLELLEPTSEDSVIAKFIAPHLAARSRPRSGSDETQAKWCPLGLRKNWNWGGRTSLYFCPSIERRRRSTRTR